MSTNPFGDFEADFKKAEKAEQATPGRVPPETYKFVLTAQELHKKPGEMVDHEVFVTPKGTKGFKLFCEIVEPEQVPNPKTGEPHITKGAVLEHPFWITQDNLPYVKRDIATILGRELESLGELTTINWAGRTFEGVVRDEEYPPGSRIIRSRIAFINPWAPKSEGGANPNGVATSSKDAGKAAEKPAGPKDETKKTEKQPEKKAAGAAKGGVDF